MTKKLISLKPSNQPASGNVAYSLGTPIIQFNFANSNSTALLGSTVRLNGFFEIENAGGKPANINPRLGIMALFDMITLSTASGNQIIEQIKFYNRFLSSFYSVNSSEYQLLGDLNCQQGSTNSLGTNDVTLKTKQAFSILLPTGLLLSGLPVPMDQGMILSLDLAPDSQVFDRKGETTSPTYKLSDLTLTCEIETNVSVPKEMVYNSISSYYSVINSGFANLTFNLNLSNVISIWANFVPSSHVNSYSSDGMRTLPLMKSNAEIVTPSQIQFLRNGEAFPFQYIQNFPFAKENILPSPQITRNYLSSIKNFRDLNVTDSSPINNNLTQSPLNLDKQAGDFVYGIGVRYDSVSDQGASFSGSSQFNLSIASDLDTNFPNSCYLFANNRSTLRFSENGVQILN